MLFSQRKGLEPVKSFIQIDSMDQDLRNGLWNALKVFYWDRVKTRQIPDSGDMRILFRRIWMSYFKQPFDTLDNDYRVTYEKIRNYFFSCEWYKVYDFIEFVAQNYPEEKEKVNEAFIRVCNEILKRELSAYRFVDGKITQMTSEEEISEIEEALAIPDALKNVKIHLETALDLMNDRKSPDYRNSIKESISAVEGICGLIAKNPKATLGQALKEVEKKVSLHSAIKNAFSNLYGYTSSAAGIRHALRDETNLSFEDAKFMLVLCAAFVNYLFAKTSQAGIKL
jgi:hypothetical protein